MNHNVHLLGQLSLHCNYLICHLYNLQKKKASIMQVRITAVFLLLSISWHME